MEVEEIKKFLNETIGVTDDILKKNKKWLSHFDGYADKILDE